MTAENLRELYEARPFRPFVIHLADGRNLPVRHPEFLAFTPKGQTVLVVQPDNSVKILDVALVTELELRPSRSGKKAA